MNSAIRKSQIEYGDFQTPPDLAALVCRKLVELGVSPKVIIEPTCGVGAFVEAAAQSFTHAQRIIGVEVNSSYLDQLRNRVAGRYRHIELASGDFFTFDWTQLLSGIEETLLVLGNFPWVTNAQQGVIGGINLPTKSNFQKHTGLAAITGKGNFDISEWMLIRVAEWLQSKRGCLAMLCKKSVARKLLTHLSKHSLILAHSAIYGIDAKKHFGASVDACLLYCEFDTATRHYDCDVYLDLDSQDCEKMGFRSGALVKDTGAFEETRYLLGNGGVKWRSGIKHDCSEVMEFKRIDETLINGLEEVVNIESNYLYPLLKGSDVANGRIPPTNRYILVTQKFVGEPTAEIQRIAPKTWAYLESHARYLDGRKSQIYRNNPRFSIFGVGDYTFKPWKVAICGLYKSLGFRLVGPLNGRAVVFDDTVYFLGFDREDAASEAIAFLNSGPAQKFLASLIFWDEKRPIKTSVLNSLDITNSRVTQPALM